MRTATRSPPQTDTASGSRWSHRRSPPACYYHLEETDPADSRWRRAVQPRRSPLPWRARPLSGSPQRFPEFRRYRVLDVATIGPSHSERRPSGLDLPSRMRPRRLRPACCRPDCRSEKSGRYATAARRRSRSLRGWPSQRASILQPADLYKDRVRHTIPGQSVRCSSPRRQ
jgi:hypothetical protein